MDSLELQHIMKKKHVSVEELCSAIGISKSAFYRKISGKTEFTIGEINKIVEHLDLRSPMGIFFTERVS